MKAAWLILVSSLQRMKALVLASFFAGLLLGLILIIVTNQFTGFDTPVRIGYLDNDSSAVSKDLENYLTESLGMELVRGDVSELESELVDKKISAIIEVPSGFEKALLKNTDRALLVTHMDDYANRALLQSYLESYTASVQILANYSSGDAAQFKSLLLDVQKEQPTIKIVKLDEQLLKWEQDWELFILLFGFFVMISALVTVGVATTVFEDRVNRTFQRVQASGVVAASYVFGVCAAGFIAAFIMVVVFVTFCALKGLVMSANLIPILLLSLLFVLFSVAFALVCGLLCKSRNSCYWLILAVSTIFCLLGGAYFPITYAPQILQQVARITPQFWLVDGIRNMAAGQSDAWILPACILSLFSLLCFLVAGIRFASRQSRAA
jgi:ABC-2 type transport system permease protein